MKITENMNVPIDYLFEVFEKSIQEDIRIQTGQEIEEKDFENFEYIKKFSKNSQATICIKHFDKKGSYHYITVTDKNKITAKYNIIPIDPKTCKLHYEETITSYNFLQKMNDTFVSLIWGYLKKKKFTEMLRQIEQSYTEV